MKLPRSTRMIRRTMRGLPAPKYGVGYEPGVRIPMADGAELLGDHYFPDFFDSPDSPDSPEPADSRGFPTLLVRSPYGRGFPWAALYGLAFAEQGFHVLIQSTRGTGGSEGSVQAWRNEGADGQATVTWLRRQPWFDGRLGLLGPSAMAYSAWALAADPPPELRAMVVHIPLHEPYGFFYRNGVFALEDALIAATAFETQHLGPRRFLGATLRLTRGMKRIVRDDRPVEAYARVMGQEVAVLSGAAAHSDPDDGYWQGTNLLDAAAGVKVPTLIVSGWRDVALDQALRQYGRLPDGSRSLMIGPWTHASALQRGMGMVLGESVSWLRGHLADPAPPKTSVRVAVGPEDGWRELPSWPPAAVPATWYVQAGGALSRTAPDSARAVGSLDHDPADPVPSFGGTGLGRTAGVRDNARLERRDDVLVFSSPPLDEAVEVIGTVAADLAVRVSGAGDATVFVRLCDVDARGRSRNVCDGIARIPSAASTATTVSVSMSATAHRFLPGHRIRLQISAGAHPRFMASRHAYHVEVQPGSAAVLPVV